MRPVNLIPAEDRRGEKAPLRTGPVGYVILAVLAVALLGVTLVVLTGNQVSDRKAEVASLQGQVDQAQARAEQLSSFGQFAALQQARQQTVTSLATSRFDWERILRELAIVTPSDVWLTELTASASGDSGASSTSSSDSSSPGAEGIVGPSLQIQGCASGHEAVAAFLASLRDIDGVTRAAVMSSDAADSSAGTAPTTGSATSGSTTAGGGGCASSKLASTFEIIVAFDAAPQSSSTTSPSAPSTSAPVASPDQSQVAGGVQQLNQATESAAQQTAKAKNEAASNTFVPGTGTTP